AAKLRRVTAVSRRITGRLPGRCGVVLAALRSAADCERVVAVTVRCLLVDDSQEFLASAARLLESQGFEIVGQATSGAEALTMAAELTPDVALVDIELGEEDGIALAQDFEANAPATRVVLISAYERDELTELIAGSSALGFLPKRSLGAGAIAALLGT